MAMRVLGQLLSYVIAAVALVAGAVAIVLLVVGQAATVGLAQEEPRKVAPRIQVWLDRKAEGLVYDERRKVAALAEKERAEKARADWIRVTREAKARTAAMARVSDEATARDSDIAQARAKAKEQAARQRRAERAKTAAKTALIDRIVHPPGKNVVAMADRRSR